MNSVMINEIFYSIQGEGRLMGLPTIFIRTTGCNLRCSYCDTTYAYDEGSEKSITEILKNISRYKCQNVCVTGGEPLIQQNIYCLLQNLSKQNYHICLETNGSKSIRSYQDINNLMISMDVKCPTSTMHEKMDVTNLSILRPQDQLKFVIGSKNDYQYAKRIIIRYPQKCVIYFQPVFGFSIQSLASWILDDHLPVYLSIQLHKYIWGKTTKK
jgi:7-carboxy-7-deazaguanine synthase